VAEADPAMVARGVGVVGAGLFVPEAMRLSYTPDADIPQTVSASNRAGEEGMAHQFQATSSTP